MYRTVAVNFAQTLFNKLHVIQTEKDYKGRRTADGPVSHLNKLLAKPLVSLLTQWLFFKV